MKHLILALLCVLLAAGTASAKRLQFGVRGGVNVTDYKFTTVSFGDIRFVPGQARTGFDVGAVLRLNLSKHLHIQSEFNYASVNYSIRAVGIGPRDLKLSNDRFEIPLQLGFQFGALRIFGGPQFRVTQSEHSSAPGWLKVNFNNDDVGLMGGIGLNIRKFFIDFRVSGYPRSRVWQNFTSDGVTKRVRVAHDIVYGGSIGFFF